MNSHRTIRSLTVSDNVMSDIDRVRQWHVRHWPCPTMTCPTLTVSDNNIELNCGMHNCTCHGMKHVSTLERNVCYFVFPHSVSPSPLHEETIFDNLDWFWKKKTIRTKSHAGLLKSLPKKKPNTQNKKRSQNEISYEKNREYQILIFKPENGKGEQLHRRI